MNGKERRSLILKLLSERNSAVSGSSLAKQFHVSRQVIVQDIALLRANGNNIISTNRGYLLSGTSRVSRVFKVHHTDNQVEAELFLIVDCGGEVKDVFISHRVYGVVQADLNIRSRQDARKFIEEIHSGRSSLLKNITSDYHYHTVLADNEETLDLIQSELEKHGFLASLQDYEPVDFRNENTSQ